MKMLCLGGIVALTLVAACAQTATDHQPAEVGASQSLPSVHLRGYGLVSGKVEYPASGGSVVRVNAESPQQAQLWQAKFRSDFALLPGVQSGELTVGGAKIAIMEAQGQGVVAALRKGATVYLLAAADRVQLTALATTLPSAAMAASSSTVEVPMYLDRWDKFSFRHYYRPWERPQDTTDASYDFTREFDYAQKQDRAGFVFWADPLATDSADGILNYGWWSWGAEEAKKRQLPVGINIGGGGETWLLNRYRGQTQMKMPGFTGNFHSLMGPSLGGQGVLSWSSTTGEDARLGLLLATVRRFAADPNVVSFLEPHGELRHGQQDIFLEYGPTADASYRRYLREKYAAPAKVAKRWGLPLGSWEQVRLPEVAAFAGWGPQARDIGGSWRVGYEELLEPVPSAYNYNQSVAPQSKAAPEPWFAADFDDASWPEVPGAGHDREMFLAKRPAVFRRHFEVSADWLASAGRVWLYEWDMNIATNQEVRLVLNGQEVGKSKIHHATPHWSAVEVTTALRAGTNTLAMRLPQGYIAYKTYLSPVEPKQYPNLGEQLNAQWVDFIDYTGWSRVQAVQRGMEMIRQGTPHHQITLMAPDSYTDGLKNLALAYGGTFHNTGYMGAFWADYLPALMRGADFPCSLEPGGPASNLADFKKQLGLYQTEGVQGIDYFIHIGDILWRPEIKAEYEAQRKQLALLGQSHYPKAQTAVLYSDRIAQLAGYPWGFAPNMNLGGGYWQWNAAAALGGYYPSDGLTPSSFANGDANAYRVIIDSNTSVMDETLVAGLEKWVRNGGTFITLAQTGRHTPETPNAWPIARLSGYQVTRIDQLGAGGGIGETGTLQAASEQQVYATGLNGVTANGLHLKKVAPEAQNLLLWNDGSVAAGMRPLGQGYIVQLGAKFTGANIFDRIEPGGNSPETRQLRELLTALLRWRQVAPEAGRMNVDNEFVRLRHGVTNNGLYDTWTLWNQSGKQAQTVSVLLGNGLKPAFSIDMRDGRQTPLSLAKLENIVLEPLETRVFLTPHGDIAQAPLAWFDLQRKWWRGTAAPPAKTLPNPSSRYACDLTPDWKFQTLDEGADATALLAADVADKDWSSRTLGMWDVKDVGGKGHGVFRKTFSVPAKWNNGLVSIWLTSWAGGSFMEKGRVWLDGQEVKKLNTERYFAQGVAELKAGSTHTLAVEVQSGGVLAGLRGQCWLSYELAAAQKIDLAGPWQPSLDGLRYEKPIPLPGKFNTQFLRRSVFIDAHYRGKNAMLTVEGDPALVSVIINGKLVRHHHHMIGERWSLNLTPFVKYGAANEIELVRWSDPGAGAVRSVFMGFFDPEVYP